MFKSEKEISPEEDHGIIVVYVALLKITMVYAYMYIYCCACIRICITICVCSYIYRGDALCTWWWTIYMMLLGYPIYTELDVLVCACTALLV